MWNIIIVFIVNLFSKRKVYKKNVHICYSNNHEHFARAKYVRTGSVGKGSFSLKYNVYERSICDECNKRYNYKVATNITIGKLICKYKIKV